jgi:DNA-binding beta-propeller fold protein YncE
VAAAIVLALLLVKSPHISRAHAASGAPWTVYVVDNSNPGHVVPLATDTSSPGVAIQVGGFPQAIAITPDSSTAWVANRDDGTIQSVSTKNNQAGATVPSPPNLLSNPGAIAIAPDGTTAFVGEDGGGAAVPLPSGPVTTLAGAGFDGEAVAVTPDGNTVYLAGVTFNGATAQRYSATPPYGKIGTPIALDTDNGRVDALAVSPDGSALYAVTSPDGGPSNLVSVPTSTHIANPSIQLGDGADGIAISPDGQTAFVVGSDNTVRSIALGTFSVTKTVTLPSGPLPTAVAITPNGQDLYVTASNNFYATPAVLVLQTANLTGPPVNLPNANPAAVAVTPDQAPVASLTVTTAAAGQPTAFNASGSTVKYGIITDYAWNFGDGSPVVHTSTPTMTHVYAAAGPYNPSVTETDSGGTSLGKVFTGQTMLRNGGPSARRTVPITVPPPTTTTNPTTGTTTPTTPTTPTTTGTTTTTASTPTISLNPTVGPPGTVVEVTGSGFPANTTLTLAWQPGIGTTRATTDQNHDLHAWVLVLPHDDLTDLLGARKLVVQESPGVSAAFLVEVSPGEPGGGEALVLYRR